MEPDPTRSADLLAFEDDAGSLRALVDGLRLSGHRVDVVHDIETLRAQFVEAGGHEIVMIAPGIPEPVAAKAAHTVLAVDASLRVVTFGEIGRGAAWPESGVVRLQAHHPASPTALGSVLRLLATRAV